MAISRSVEPIVSQEHAVTRCAVTTEKEAEAQSGDNRTMGRKFTVPYALYRVHGFVNPYLAEKTGFGADDLELFWKALEQMFEFDKSAARTEMFPQALILFEHESPLGAAPANKLFERVAIKRTEESADIPARSFKDYEVVVDEENLPEGVKIIRRF